MTKKIAKKDIPKLFEKLSEFEIFAPADDGGVYLFCSGQDLPLLDYTNSQKPPKDIFFPQTEKMFDLVREDKIFVGASEPEGPDKPVLVFGIRPCDVKAVTILDRVFTDDYLDPYYAARREGSVVISFSCVPPLMPLKNCFCTSLGGNPSSQEGSDMLWTDLGDSYLVESITDKGNNIIELGGKLFQDAKPEDEKKGEDAKKKGEEAISRKLDTSGVEEALSSAFPSDYWEEFAKRCLGCGICTLLCPTCQCFDINDITRKGKGWRERTWDSCQYPYYTLHASGHNPRPEKRYRQRNRICHKYLYQPKNMDLIGCVGCGRCINGCPVDIDIIEVIEGVKEAGK